MRAVIYCRISNDDGRALGVKRQEVDCRTLCDQRGWDVADVLVDNDMSAFTGRRRPGYETLLDGIQTGRWDVLVVWHPDRLHRRPVELEAFIDAVEATGTQITTVTAGEWDLATPEGRLMARITGSVARKESEDKSRRASRKQQEIAAAGGVSGGGSRPFGYEADKVTVRPEEAALIREGVARVLAGGSVRGVALDWRTRTSGAWTSTTVRRVLLSARIAGLRSHHGTVVGPAIWPAIIDPDDLFRVRAVLSETRPAAARSWLLTGFVRCAVCDRLLVSNPARRNGRLYRSYKCSRDRGGCGGIRVAAEATEAVVAEAVVEFLSRLPLPEMAPSVPDTDDVDARMVELAEMWADGQIGSAEWSSARGLLERRRAKIVAEGAAVAEREARAGWASPDAGGAWEQASFEERRAMIGSVVDRVEVRKATSSRWDPARLNVVWRDM